MHGSIPLVSTVWIHGYSLYLSPQGVIYSVSNPISGVSTWEQHGLHNPLLLSYRALTALSLIAISLTAAAGTPLS